MRSLVLDHGTGRGVPLRMEGDFEEKHIFSEFRSAGSECSKVKSRKAEIEVCCLKSHADYFSIYTWE